jgi:adenosylmethionine-8-amino-7-oxononanoate aminotransferase
MRHRKVPFHFHGNTKNSTALLDRKGSSSSLSSPSTGDWIHPVLQRARRRTTPDHLSVDRFHVWHPYSSVISPSSPTLPISHARGSSLYLEYEQDGRHLELIDGMSSWWSAVWGYCNPILDAAMETQLQRMSHVMFGGLTHRPAVELSDLLMFATNSISSSSSLKQRQNPFSAIFYADSGSIAVEVSLKMALQYWHGRAVPQKRKFLALRGGYHGGK